MATPAESLEQLAAVEMQLAEQLSAVARGLASMSEKLDRQTDALDELRMLFALYLTSPSGTARAEPGPMTRERLEQTRGLLSGIPQEKWDRFETAIAR